MVHWYQGKVVQRFKCVEMGFSVLIRLRQTQWQQRGQVWEMHSFALENTIPNLWKGYCWCEHILKRLKGNTVYSWHHLLIPFCLLLFLVLSISLLKCNRILESQIICLYDWGLIFQTNPRVYLSESFTSHFDDCFKDLFLFWWNCKHWSEKEKKTKDIFFPSNCTRF